MCVYNLLRRGHKISKIHQVKSKPEVIRRRKAKGSSLGQPVASSRKIRKGEEMADIRSKRLKRIKTQAFLTCILSLGTLMAAGTATFAWFTTNKTATAKYLNIVAADTSIVDSVTYYKIASVSGNKYTFTDIATTYDIGQYDSALGTKEHQILIKVVFKDTVNTNITVKAVANSDILQGGHDWGVVAKDENGDSWHDTSNFPLSSIIKFDYFGTSADTTTTSGSIIVDKSAITAETSFITLDGTTPTYTTSFNIGSETPGGTNPIYIMLDYNEDAIASIYSFTIGNEYFSDAEKSVDFKCDFSIVVSAD